MLMRIGTVLRRGLERAYQFSNGRIFYEKDRYGTFAVGVGYWVVDDTNVVAPANTTGQALLHWLRYAYQAIVNAHRSP